MASTIRYSLLSKGECEGDGYMQVVSGQTDTRRWLTDSASDLDQEYIYILSDELNITLNSKSNGY